MRSAAAAKAQLDALYREVPSIACQRRCQSACGPINMAFVEWERIKKKLGYTPVAPTPNPLVPKTLECPMLKGGLCSVYEVRPMICRLWGVTATMRCPWGCEPERVLTTREAYVLIARAHMIGAQSADEEAEYAALVTRLESEPDETFAVSELLHIQPRMVGR